MQLNENRIQNIRNDFPILKETVYGKPLVYFDMQPQRISPHRVAQNRVCVQSLECQHTQRYSLSEPEGNGST